MHSTQEIADRLGLVLRMVQKHCANLGFPKIGRDYLLDDEQVARMQEWILAHPVGRPRNEK